MDKYLLEKKKYSVKDYIASALLEILEKKSFSKVSITELCDKAKVSRISFYRNFDYLEDPIKYYLKEDIDLWWSKLDKKDEKEIEDTFLPDLFKHFLEKKSIMMMLKKNRLLIVLKDVIYLSSGPIENLSEDDAYTKAAFFGAIYGVLEEWIKRGMNNIPPIKHLSRRDYD